MRPTFSKHILRRSTRGRKRVAIFASLLWLLAFIFLLLVNIGQVRNQSPLNTWYFFRFDVSNIIPESTENAAVFNSFAKSVGLHDFYDVAMWGFCEGYYNEGVTDCSKPQLLYWFDPLAIMQKELLRGAQGKLVGALARGAVANFSPVSLPAEVLGYLHIVQVASQVMFGCFFASVMACFVSIFLVPLVVHSKLLTVPIAIFSFMTTAAVVIGAGISTGIWTILQMELKNYASEVNIVADLGLPMFVFQWCAAGCAMIAMIIQFCLTCCGTSRRDIKIGRKKTVGEKEVDGSADTSLVE
jgi:hypothetical protein